MGLFLRRQLLALTALLLVGVQAGLAQDGGITGRVTNVETGAPLASARVELVGDAGQVRGSALTDDGGQFRVTGVPAGVYTLVVALVGYETQRIEGVRIVVGASSIQAVSLAPLAVRLNPVIVSASRRQEKVLDAPAAVSVIGAEQIRARPALSATDHVRAVPGVDVASTGLIQSNLVTRGFNNVFSGSLLMLTDNRYASVPSLRVNAPYLISTTDEDIERIEVLLGPGAALYGPNAANGVLHLITRSPFESLGTHLSVAGGERSVFQGTARHAGMIGERVAFKISGQYMQGHDWEHEDPAEVRARDFDIERWSGEARLDFRPDERTELILSSGVSHLGSGIEMTGLGAAQGMDWRYTYYQARIRRDRLFGQLFLNTSDAGETFLLRTGQPIVDRSRLLVAQVQHGADVGTRQSFTYGIDFQRTEPRTESTINGRNEGDDGITEVGGYLHSVTSLSPRLELVAAGRFDHHSRLNDAVFSPRAALVFKPAETQNFRLTYNRAFSTPTSNNLFLDIVAGTAGPYQVRAIGVPKDGLAYRRDCAGGLESYCMRSPFEANPSSYLAAEATQLWAEAVEYLRAQGGPDLRPIPAPTSAQVGTSFRVLNPTNGAFYDIAPGAITDIDPLEPTITSTIETGYKGVFGDRVSVSASVYFERRNNFVGPLIVETPNVFFERASLTAYLANFMSPEEAAAVAAAMAGIAGSTQPQTRGIPLGTITPDHPLTASPSLFLTYRNFGEVDLWGSDLSAQVLLDDRFSVGAAYAYVSTDYFSKEEVGGLSDIALNAPRHKGAVYGGFRDEDRGLDAELRARFSDSFPMNSGVYVGTVDPSYVLLDASFGFRLPFAPGARVSVSAQNLLDNRHREFVGAPELGRMVLTRLHYEF